MDIETSTKGLQLDALQRLIRRETLVLRIPGFVDPETCRKIGVGLQCEGYNDYLNAPSVGRIGMSFFETARNPETVAFYFDHALDNMQRLRRACAPFQCPIDTFRCTVDEIWPGGAHLQELYGRKMFAGLSRNMRPGTPLLAHHDLFARHAPDAPEANDVQLQIAVNVYVAVPEQGGELLMWKTELDDAEFLERRGSAYGMALAPLGKADIAVKPEVGELILFNSRKLHAVAAGEGEDRLTVSCFVGHRGDGHPLTFWS